MMTTLNKTNYIFSVAMFFVHLILSLIHDERWELLTFTEQLD